VLVCESVVRELKASAAPYVVRSWIERPPEWCEPLPDPPLDAASEFLDAGERAAIALALSSGADRLLIDDWEGRAEAIRLHLAVTGTLGILAEAHRHNLLDFETMLTRLGQTNFYLSPGLLDRVRQSLTKGERLR
jgi:predicted nucleic acid-binding protein